MLTASRSFGLSSRSAPPLPMPGEFAPLWEWGVTPREGQVIMVAGRSGSQKSGFAMRLTSLWNLPTLYVTGDMTPFEATTRLVSMRTLETIEEIEAGLAIDEQRYLHTLDDCRITLAPMSPITWNGIGAELTAWTEIHNSHPRVIVLDNLMDFEGCESDYTAQMAAMQNITALSRETGATVIVLHHATDKSDRAKTMPGHPPARSEIKGGHQEKPQLTLTCALHDESGEFRLACVKQRSGRSDPGAEDIIRLRAWPQYTRFGPLGSHLERSAA